MLGINAVAVLAAAAAWLAGGPRLPPAALPDRDPRQINQARKHSSHRRRRK